MEDGLSIQLSSLMLLGCKQHLAYRSEGKQSGVSSSSNTVKDTTKGTSKPKNGKH